MDYYDMYYRPSAMNTAVWISVLMIVAVVTALAATVLAFIFIVPEKKSKKLGGIGKLLHDICNFKFLIIEKILQALYIFTSVFLVLASLFMGFVMFSESVGGGLMLILFGPIISLLIARLSYEGVMLLILAVKNIIQINNKLKNQNENDAEDLFAVDGLKDKYKKQAPAEPAATPTYTDEVYTAPVPTFETPVAPPQAPAAAQGPRFCARCGSATVNGHCPNGCI